MGEEKEKDRLSIFIDAYVKHVEDRFDKFFPKGNDAKVADAILELFRKRENLEIFNKKALYIYIREIMASHGLEVKTPKITNRVPFFKPFTVPDTTIASKSLVLLLQLVINNAIKAGKIEYFMVFN